MINSRVGWVTRGQMFYNGGGVRSINVGEKNKKSDKKPTQQETKARSGIIAAGRHLLFLFLFFLLLFLLLLLLLLFLFLLLLFPFCNGG